MVEREHSLGDFIKQPSQAATEGGFVSPRELERLRSFEHLCNRLHSENDELRKAEQQWRQRNVEQELHWEEQLQEESKHREATAARCKRLEDERSALELERDDLRREVARQEEEVRIANQRARRRSSIEGGAPPPPQTESEELQKLRARAEQLAQELDGVANEHATAQAELERVEGLLRASEQQRSELSEHFEDLQRIADERAQELEEMRTSWVDMQQQLDESRRVSSVRRMRTTTATIPTETRSSSASGGVSFVSCYDDEGREEKGVAPLKFKAVSFADELEAAQDLDDEFRHLPPSRDDARAPPRSALRTGSDFTALEIDDSAREPQQRGRKITEFACACLYFMIFARGRYQDDGRTGSHAQGFSARPGAAPLI
eukprot:TRINITY_DN25467_c0_g1_i1.p1 TRINITY_DN25467_c0_g1~~TRINITY_DN25467_c0_g1_i1.p1  ORF type:complete len:376 (-),score=114.83 TRINITY_DN25467_c0_g1_i1:155-1282(-)